MPIKPPGDLQFIKRAAKAYRAEQRDEVEGKDWRLHIEALDSNSDRVRDIGLRMINSKDPLDVIIGSEIIGRVIDVQGSGDDDVLHALIRRIGTERNVEVVKAAADALARFDRSEAIRALLPLAFHEQAELRMSFVLSMSTSTVGDSDADALRMVMALCSDRDPTVREWACFVLGTQMDVDSGVVREVLLQRLADKNYEVRSEAIFGLARRDDQRVIPHLRDHLNAASVGRLIVRAAYEVAKPELQPRLLQLVSWWDVDEELLIQAISRCDNTAAALARRVEASLTRSVRSRLGHQRHVGAQRVVCVGEYPRTSLVAVIRSFDVVVSECWSIWRDLLQTPADADTAFGSGVVVRSLVSGIVGEDSASQVGLQRTDSGVELGPVR